MVRIVAASIAMSLVVHLDGAAFGESLASRFSVPRSGHIELERSVGVRVEGMNVDSVEDVLRLYDRLAEVQPTDELVRSWEFLATANIKKAPEAPIPPPPGGATKVRRLPEWRKVVVDFEPSRHAQVETIEDTLHKVVVGPKSDVVAVANDSIDHRQIDHFPAGKSHRWLLNGRLLLSRSKDVFERDWKREPRGENVLYRCLSGSGGRLLLADPSLDGVFALIYAGKNARVSRFSLHLAPTEIEAPQQRLFPTLTYVFSRTETEGLWRAECYAIKQATFDEPVDKSRFVVPVERDEAYVMHDSDGRRRSLPILRPLSDIAPLSPAAVEFIMTSGEKPEPGAM